MATCLVRLALLCFVDLNLFHFSRGPELIESVAVHIIADNKSMVGENHHRHSNKAIVRLESAAYELARRLAVQRGLC